MNAYSSDEYDDTWMGGDSTEEEVVDVETSRDSEESEEQEEETDVKEPGVDQSDFSFVHANSETVIIVNNENRRTSLVMNTFEMAEHNNIRGTQIEAHGNCFADSVDGLDDPIKMAQRELMQRRSPLVLRRKVGYLKNTKTGQMETFYEYFSPNEMQFATTYPDVL